MVYPPQLVVEGWIDEGGFPVVILSETVPISDIYADVNTLNDRVIKWAKVSIDDGENEVILTGKNSPSYFPPYIYTTSRMRGVAPSPRQSPPLPRFHRASCGAEPTRCRLRRGFV